MSRNWQTVPLGLIAAMTLSVGVIYAGAPTGASSPNLAAGTPYNVYNPHTRSLASGMPYNVYNPRAGSLASGFPYDVYNPHIRILPAGMPYN